MAVTRARARGGSKCPRFSTLRRSDSRGGVKAQSPVSHILSNRRCTRASSRYVLRERRPTTEVCMKQKARVSGLQDGVILDAADLPPNKIRVRIHGASPEESSTAKTRLSASRLSEASSSVQGMRRGFDFFLFNVRPP